jgi:hypothetical protein
MPANSFSSTSDAMSSCLVNHISVLKVTPYMKNSSLAINISSTTMMKSLTCVCHGELLQQPLLEEAWLAHAYLEHAELEEPFLEQGVIEQPYLDKP